MLSKFIKEGEIYVFRKISELLENRTFEISDDTYIQGFLTLVKNGRINSALDLSDFLKKPIPRIPDDVYEEGFLAHIENGKIFGAKKLLKWTGKPMPEITDEICEKGFLVLVNNKLKGEVNYHEIWSLMKMKPTFKISNKAYYSTFLNLIRKGELSLAEELLEWTKNQVPEIPDEEYAKIFLNFVKEGMYKKAEKLSEFLKKPVPDVPNEVLIQRFLFHVNPNNFSSDRFEKVELLFKISGKSISEIVPDEIYINVFLSYIEKVKRWYPSHLIRNIEKLISLFGRPPKIPEEIRKKILKLVKKEKEVAKFLNKKLHSQ